MTSDDLKLVIDAIFNVKKLDFNDEGEWFFKENPSDTFTEEEAKDFILDKVLLDLQDQT